MKKKTYKEFKLNPRNKKKEKLWCEVKLSSTGRGEMKRCGGTQVWRK